MILAVLLDTLRTKGAWQSTWQSLYQLFINRCITDGWVLITQECYASWIPERESQIENLSSGGEVWDYTYIEPEKARAVHQYIIPDNIFEELDEREGSLLASSLSLQQNRYMVLEDALESCLDEIKSRYNEKIEAVIVFENSIESVSYFSKKHGFDVLYFAVGPMRLPTYKCTAFLTHDTVGKTKPNECEERYSEFCKVAGELPILDNSELLAIFLEDDYLKYLKLINAVPKREILHAGTMSFSPNYIRYSLGSDYEALNEIKSIYGNNFAFRPDVRDYSKGLYELPDENLDAIGYPNIISILMSKRVSSIGGNILFDTMLWDRTACCKDKSFNIHFMCQKNYKKSEERRTPAEFLNFYLFCYLVPISEVTTHEYLKWRLTNPSETQIYNRSLSYWLKLCGADESILALPKGERLRAILKARGADDDYAVPFKRLEDESLKDFWQRVEEFVLSK